MRTETAIPRLARLVRRGLAGERSTAALAELVERCPECQAVVFELVLGPVHSGEVDFGLRLHPEAMESALQNEPGLADWREIAVLRPARGWLERDADRPGAPLSVFGQFAQSPHPSDLGRLLRRLHALTVRLPQDAGIRHVGVLHGRAAREVRLVVSGADLDGVAASAGVSLPVAPRGRWHLALGIGASGWLERRGLERIQRGEERLPDVPMTAAQRELLRGWRGQPGCGISHLKWVEPDGVVKAYLSVS
jgi:hypothetical protein